MRLSLRDEADLIIRSGLSAVLPDEAVKRELKQFKPSSGKTILISVGKAAWRMAKAAADTLERIDAGIVITKYDHTEGEIPGIVCYEAGHPIPDENGFHATDEVLKLTEDLKKDDTVLFLLSGGGSALFEKPLISGEELSDITGQLMACGADIVEINIIRKRLSAVKGGRFAKLCAPARVFSIVLSDIIGDPLDMIASGPAYPDTSTCEEAKEIVNRYGISLSKEAKKLLEEENPKELDNVETIITGSVSRLCRAVSDKCAELGYTPLILTDRLCCEAREAGSFLSAVLKTHSEGGKNLAFIAGGETVVHLKGKGKGGRNQELALSAASGISGLDNVCLFSFGSDGTDGPTDAAGGYVDGRSKGRLEELGVSIPQALSENDSYEALSRIGGLIKTGPTGTNVNDVAIGLIRG